MVYHFLPTHSYLFVWYFHPAKYRVKDAGFLIRNVMRINFRGITCVISRANCASCSIRNNCLYNLYFNRAVEGINAKAFNLYADTKNDQEGYVKRININLKIWGDAIKHKEFFVFALMRMARVGLGKRRTVFSIDYVYDKASEVVLYGDYQKIKSSMMKYFTKNTMSNRIQLQFISPIGLNSGDEIKVNVGPCDIIEAIQNRFRLLQNEYGICTSDVVPSFKLPPIKLESKTFKWINKTRYSYIQGKKLLLRGHLGYMIFSPAEEQVRTWLSIGEIIGVGRGTSFGWGRIKYKILEDGGD